MCCIVGTMRPIDRRGAVGGDCTADGRTRGVSGGMSGRDVLTASPSVNIRCSQSRPELEVLPDLFKTVQNENEKEAKTHILGL